MERAQSYIDLIYETRDGYISVAVNTDKEWAGPCRALGRPELVRDPRFETPRLRHLNIDERLALTQEARWRGARPGSGSRGSKPRMSAALPS